MLLRRGVIPSCAVTFFALVSLATGRFLPMSTPTTYVTADPCDQYLSAGSTAASTEVLAMQYVLCKYPRATVEELLAALGGGAGEAVGEGGLAGRNKRKLSVDMDTDLAAEHFRQVQAQRRKLQNDLGVLEHFMHVGRK